MIRTLCTGLAGATLSVVAITTAYATGAVTAPTAVATTTAGALPARTAAMRTPCAEEDSTDCAWNAHTRGNGRGYSFYAFTFRLRSASGRHIVGAVDCHTFVNRHADRRYGECQLVRPIRGTR
jgi:hypothetical protein